MAEPKQHVYRVGWHHNKWLIVVPADQVMPSTVEKAIPILKRVVQEKNGEYAITSWDHVEYLGKG